MEHQEFNFNIHKTNFYGQYWRAENTKAVILLVHGMGEHSGRYANFVVPKFIENNYSVLAFDHFGHGKTEGKRGHTPSFCAVLDSVEITIKKAKKLFPDLPIFLYGHSMGGNVVINYTLRREHDFNGVVATSPFLRLAFQPPAWKMSLGRLMKKIAPSITMGNELDANDISRDKQEVKKYKNDPLVHDQVSPNFSIAFIEAGNWAIENAKTLKIPMLLVHGTADKIIDYKATEEFAKQSKKANLKLYKDGYHELHNDFCKSEMITDVLAWLDTKL